MVCSRHETLCFKCEVFNGDLRFLIIDAAAAPKPGDKTIIKSYLPYFKGVLSREALSFHDTFYHHSTLTQRNFPASFQPHFKRRKSQKRGGLHLPWVALNRCR